MNVSLGGHRLLPDGKMPLDPEGLVHLLRRAMPYELFDPSEHALETTVRLFVCFFIVYLFSCLVSWLFIYQCLFSHLFTSIYLFVY